MRVVVSCVVVIHLSIIMWFFRSENKILPKKRAMTVQTVCLATKKTDVKRVDTEKKKQTTSPVIEKKQNVPSKTQPAPKPVKKNEKKTVAKTEKQQVVSHQNNAFIAEALKALDDTDSHMLENKKKSADTAMLQRKVSSLSESAFKVIDDGKDAECNAFYDLLIQRMQAVLTLPEREVMKIRLTLSSDGKMLRCEIVVSKSKKNREYIEKMIRAVSFPAFGTMFSGKKEHTFYLHLDV